MRKPLPTRSTEIFVITIYAIYIYIYIVMSGQLEFGTNLSNLHIDMNSNVQ